MDLRITRASAELAKHFKAQRGAQKSCADATKIPQDRLSRLAAGRAFPRTDESLAIEDVARIPVAWWGQPPLPEKTEETRAEPAVAGPRSAEDQPVINRRDDDPTIPGHGGNAGWKEPEPSDPSQAGVL